MISNTFFVTVSDQNVSGNTLLLCVIVECIRESRGTEREGKLNFIKIGDSDVIFFSLWSEVKNRSLSISWYIMSMYKMGKKKKFSQPVTIT